MENILFFLFSKNKIFLSFGQKTEPQKKKANRWMQKQNNSVAADLESIRLLFLQANFIQLINSYCKPISLMGF